MWRFILLLIVFGFHAGCNESEILPETVIVNSTVNEMPDRTIAKDFSIELEFHLVMSDGETLQVIH